MTTHKWGLEPCCCRAYALAPSASSEPEQSFEKMFQMALSLRESPQGSFEPPRREEGKWIQR